MTRKNKIMLVAAIVAALLLVGSGVARCTLARSAAPEGGAVVESVEEATAESSQSETDAAGGGSGSGIESLIGTSWVGLDDATRSLSIVKGAFVEAKDGGTEVTYWTLDSEESLSSGIEATVLASKSMTDAASPVLVSVSSDGAETVLRSDVLACAYRQVQLGDRSLHFTGVTSKLEEAMGVDAAKIEAAVSTRAAAVSPNATRAIWDAEAWIDYANNAATTTFTLDDGASTIISVTRSSDGTIEAL